MRRTFFFWSFLAACSGGPEPAPAKPLRDFRGIIHCHSRYSHDSKGTYEEILAAAKAAKVDFICMTDHPPKGDPGLSLREGWKGLHDGVLFIQGAEYSDNILGLGLKESISGKDRRATIKAIHDQGGVAIACHPEGIADWSEFDEADGMEIYNVHAAVMKHKNDPVFAAKVIKVLKEDPERSFQLLQELDPAVLAKWDEINVHRHFTGIAGNDSHQNVQFFGAQLDPYPRAFRFVTTHVLAEELSQFSILDAIRRGRCYVAFESELLMRRHWLSCFGLERGPEGDVLRVFNGNLLPGPLQVYRDGHRVTLKSNIHPGQGLTLTPDGPGSYRAVLVGRIADREVPFTLTNPVHVR